MKRCRECQHKVSEQALSCPGCGAPYPAKAEWDGWGFEYRSETEILGLPLLHISFKYRPNRMPVPARGVIAIGQFSAGIFNISQFSIGLFSLSQFTLSMFAVTQFGISWSLIAQFGLYIDQGKGQLVWNLLELLERL